VNASMMEGISVRCARREDEALLFALFAAEKAAEFAAIGLPEVQYRPLLEMQYRGRAMTHSVRYPEAEDWIVCAPDGTALGGYLLAKTSQEARLMDLAVLPQWRGRGIGTRVLLDLMTRSATAGVPLKLQVMKGNRAVRLYARLGFQVVGEGEITCEMIWRQTLELRPETKEIFGWH
jgi:ribosomal protein S18 acetylase RimI-like enzyme